MLFQLERIARTLVAGLLGGLRALAILAVALTVGVVLMQVGLRWYASGELTLFPGASPPVNRAVPVAVLGATPAEAARIRGAVARLRYELPPHSITFQVIGRSICPQCGGDFVPALDLVQIERSVVDAGGPELEHTVAHEVGHFVDQHYLNDAQHARYKQLRHIPARLTWLAPDKPWELRPSEDFGEVFAVLNLPLVDSPPGTAYGPVRDPAAYERLLASAGVRLGARSTEPDWTAALAQEFATARDEMSIPTVRYLVWLVIVTYLAFGIIPAMHDAWRR